MGFALEYMQACIGTYNNLYLNGYGKCIASHQT